MDFTFDVRVIKQPLGVAASQVAHDGPRRADKEREHATLGELLLFESGPTGWLKGTARILQEALQRIAHDILETEASQPRPSRAGEGAPVCRWLSASQAS